MGDVYEEIEKAHECDVRHFWKLINDKRGNNINFCQELSTDGVCVRDDDSIANGFARYYEDIHTPNTSQNFDGIFYEHVEGELKRCLQDGLSHIDALKTSISVNEVREIIKSLKKSKASGHDLICNEHLIYGSDYLIECMAILFTRMIDQCYIPVDCKKA